MCPRWAPGCGAQGIGGDEILRARRIHAGIHPSCAAFSTVQAAGLVARLIRRRAGPKTPPNGS